MTLCNAVKPCKPLAPYQGGKIRLASTIIKHIEGIPHTSYVEPFCGMGGIFFRRPTKPNNEVINDFNGEVANLFRILQRHHTALIDLLNYTITCRKEFERQKAIPVECLTDLERAARFLYLQRVAFGGRVTGQSFGVRGDERRAPFNPRDVQEYIQELSFRLSGVVIENLDYAECIRRYDREKTLFYLDPPYWGTEHVYGRALFGRDEYAKMARQLTSIKGRFILSLNDTPEIREIFLSFKIEEAVTLYTLSSNL